MREYQITLTGVTPLLLHHDNIEWADSMEAWKSDPANKGKSKAGDDRTPAWRWLGCLYHDNEHVCIPQANIMRCLMEGGAMIPVPGAKNNKTFKAQTQSGMMSTEPNWTLFVADAAPFTWAEIKERFGSESEFAKHKMWAKDYGFNLLVKRAKIGQTKHIRVRPEFPQWKVRGALSVWDEQITEEVLRQILEYAGRYKGLGDWRPGGKTPGPYGMFEVEID